MPGHTAPAWCVGHPNICVGGSSLDPSKKETYEVIAKLLKHAADLFPDHVLHLGGDEVDLSAWTSSPQVAAYLKQQHPGMPLVKAAETEAYASFVGKIGAMAAQHGKRVAHWEDVFDWAAGGKSGGGGAGASSPASKVCGGVRPALPTNNSLVQVFRAGWGAGANPGRVCGSNAATTTALAVAAGYEVIWGAGPPSGWYLTCYADACDDSGGGAGFESWESIYSREPFHNPHLNVSITDPAEQARVLGGEVTVWSERLDPAIALPTAFPRAAAAAERMWSSRATDLVAETASAKVRLERLRCLYLELGLAVSTLDGGNEASNTSLPSRPAGPGSYASC